MSEVFARNTSGQHDDASGQSIGPFSVTDLGRKRPVLAANMCLNAFGYYTFWPLGAIQASGYCMETVDANRLKIWQGLSEFFLDTEITHRLLTMSFA